MITTHVITPHQREKLILEMRLCLLTSYILGGVWGVIRKAGEITVRGFSPMERAGSPAPLSDYDTIRLTIIWLLRAPKIESVVARRNGCEKRLAKHCGITRDRIQVENEEVRYRSKGQLARE